MAGAGPTPPLAPTPPIAEAIYCHRLIDADAFVAQQAALARKVFGVKSSSPENVFTVTPDGTGIDLSAVASDLASAKSQGVPGSAADADACARELLTGYNQAADAAGITRALHAQALFPSDLKLSYASAVYNPETQDLVQWLCQYQSLISTGSSRGSVVVADATFTLRIGSEKAVCRFAARWCPISASSLCSPLPPPDIRDLPWSSAAQERAGYSGDDLDTNPAYSLCYARADESLGWLVPYYVFAADPMQTLYSAARSPAD